MNNKRRYILIVLTVVTILLTFASYLLGTKLGYQRGAANIQEKYYDIPKQEFGNLLDQVGYLINLSGKVTDIKNKSITINNGSQNLDINFRDQTVFVKGPSFDQPEKMGGASFDDMKIGDRVWLNAYLKENNNLYSYQIFIYK